MAYMVLYLLLLKLIYARLVLLKQALRVIVLIYNIINSTLQEKLILYPVWTIFSFSCSWQIWVDYIYVLFYYLKQLNFVNC